MTLKFMGSNKCYMKDNDLNVSQKDYYVMDINKTTL